MSQEQKGWGSPVVQTIAGKINELLVSLHPEDEKLVLEHLGLQKLDSGTIDPPPEGPEVQKRGAASSPPR